MSWLSRIFGGAGALADPPLPRNAVVIPDDIAAALIAGFGDLGSAVETALRAHLAAEAKLAAARGDGIPFWLQRDAAQVSDIEDELRDRVTQRRTGETES